MGKPGCTRQNEDSQENAYADKVLHGLPKCGMPKIAAVAL
jgi:hypothetical protein